MEERYRLAVRERVAEFESATLPAPTPRAVRLLQLQGKADVVVGMRRVGKSWLLLHRIQELLALGVPRSRICYFEFEDERLAGMTADSLRFVDEEFFARNPESRAGECWFFFDEIQEVPGWEKYVRRLLGEPKFHIAVTGSSARLLGKEIASSLRGRALTTELLPFSFAESVEHIGLVRPSKWPVAGPARARLQRAFEHHLSVGGFPEVQGLEASAWRRVLQSYLEVALLRDVAERHGISNVQALRFVVRRLLRSVGSRITANGLLKDLQSQKVGIGKDQVYALLAHLEDAFLVFLLPLYTNSERRRQMNPRKVYAIDHGLVRACTPSVSGDIGHRLENMVYLELRRRGEVLGHQINDDGSEVDFVFESSEGDRSLVQACADLGRNETRERELSALATAAAETRIDSATVVSLAEEGTEVRDGVSIRIVPAWRWLLQK